MGNAGFGDLKAVGNFSGGQVTAFQDLQYLPSGLIGQREKEIIHFCDQTYASLMVGLVLAIILLRLFLGLF